MRSNKTFNFRILCKIGFGSLLIVFLLFALNYCIAYIPIVIDRDYPGIKFRVNTSETLSNTTVHIDGKLYHRLFQKPIFKGSIVCPELEESITYDAQILFPSGFDDTAYMHYTGIKNNGTDVVPEVISYATVRTDEDFSYMILNIFEPEASANNKSLKDLVIVAPANNYEEGKQIIDTHGSLSFPIQ